MRSDLLASLRLAGVTIAICVVAYPLVILTFATVVVPDARMASLVVNSDGRVVGSRLVAQSFSRPEYFWPRPSAVDYNATAAGGSNLSPANPAIRERAEEVISRLEQPSDTQIPVDLVTASGAGLDPHISLAGAMVQVRRVASARDLDEDEVRRLVDQIAEEIPLMANAERIVNVLELNMALEALERANARDE
jgi:K+-transporting ATPase ATPase C chain